MPFPYNHVVKQSADPAANNEIAYTSDEDVFVKHFDVALVTDANAANRQVEFTFEDADGHVYFRVAAGGTQAASLTRNYSARSGDYGAPSVAGDVFAIPLPREGVWLPVGGKIKTVTTSRQATDNFGVLTLLAERG